MQLDEQSPRVAAVARRICAAERAPDRSPSEVADRVLRSLRVDLGRWIGTDAYDALVERACAEVRGNRSAARLTWRPGASPSVQGLGTDAEEVDTVERIVGTLVRLLGRFVGDDLAARLVLQGWSDREPEGP